MSVLRQLEDANNQESEQNNTSEDELTRIFQLTKGELEVLLIQRVEQLIGPVMEHLVRRIVKEKLEFLEENLMTSIKCKCSKQLGTSESRSLQLKFLDKISLPVFTSEKIKGEGCTSIRVALVDSLTGEVVKSGREATANVELVVLEGDSSGDGGDNWTVEDFNNKIVRARNGKKSLLKGHTCLNLKEGISNISDISFIQNSGWTKRRELRLGARVVDDFPGTTIKPTKTESFTLKDFRTQLYVKKHPPSLSDEVWRLEKICRKGAFRRLSKENITTVKEFRKFLVMNPRRLKEILRVGDKTWKVITDHAMTCVIDDVVHLYYDPNSQQKTGVVFNVVGQVKGLVKESQYVLIDKLSEKEKGNAQKWVIRAFEHWNEVIPFDDEKCFMESFSHFSESLRLESGNCEPPSMMNTQPVTSSHGIIPSISCIGESSRLNGSHPGNDDFLEQLMNIPGEGSYCPLYSPDAVISPYLAELELEHPQFLNNNHQYGQTESPIVADKTSPGICMLVGSQDNSSVNSKVHRRWRRVFIVLIATGKTNGPPERIHVHKKQRVS